MKQVMREQTYSCGVVAGFLKSYAECVAQAAHERISQCYDDDSGWLYSIDRIGPQMAKGPHCFWLVCRKDWQEAGKPLKREIRP